MFLSGENTTTTMYFAVNPKTGKEDAMKRLLLLSLVLLLFLAACSGSAVRERGQRVGRFSGAVRERREHAGRLR